MIDLVLYRIRIEHYNCTGIMKNSKLRDIHFGKCRKIVSIAFILVLILTVQYEKSIINKVGDSNCDHSF